MHCYIATRGILHDSERFIKELSSKYVPFNYLKRFDVNFNPKKDKPNEMMKGTIQIGVRPIQLFEVVFPEESKDVVFTTLFGESGDGKTQHKKHQKLAWAFQKALKIEPMPETWDKSFHLNSYRDNMEIIGLGVKPDYWIDKECNHIDNPTEEQKKEMMEGI